MGQEVVMITGDNQEVSRPVVKLAHSARCTVPSQWIMPSCVPRAHARGDARERDAGEPERGVVLRLGAF